MQCNELVCRASKCVVCRVQALALGTRTGDHYPTRIVLHSSCNQNSYTRTVSFLKLPEKYIQIETSKQIMALKKVKGNLERMFDKNLTDLVRGIRNNRDNEVSSDV